MLNRLTNVLADSAPASRDRRWQTDAQPGLRLVWLAVLMISPLVLIGGRVAYLQTSTFDRFAEPFERTDERYESVSSRDGRLLSADGRVLAVDRQQFAVKMHYRWLEEPADAAWLRGQALSRLSRKDRRNAALVAAKIEEILAERNATWQRLAKVTERSPAELSAKRSAIQTRIERIVASVEARRKQSENQSDPLSPSSHVPGSWSAFWETLSRAVTTPPPRPRRDPLIVQEEQEYHALLTGISLSALAEIEAHPDQYPGLEIETLTWRDYPQDTLAAHVIGLRRPLTEEERDNRQQQFAGHDPQDYHVGDRLGRLGLERTYDHELHGVRGVRRIVRNRRGEIIQTELVRAPRSGRDLVLTLNASLQERLEQLVDQTLAAPKTEMEADPDTAITKTDNAGASVVVLDVRTGAVVSAVSAPRFSLSEVMHPTPEQWAALTADPKRPLFHRAAQMAVAPGSVFKAVTAVALLESGKFDPDAHRYCQGFLDRPDRDRCYVFRHFGVGHGEMNLSQALCQSCNTYFFQGARRVGPQILVDWAERFGIGQATGLDLPGEQAGNLPRPPLAAPKPTGSPIVQTSLRTETTPRTPWYPGDTLGLAIGQSRLTVTPLQMARMMAAIANNGYLVTPHLVQGYGPSSLKEEQPARFIPLPEPRRLPELTEGTLARVREGLEMVVAHPQGTAYKTVRLPQVNIAGKTGTAEVGGGRPDHAWFVGYVPADRPKYAFAVILEHAGSGSQAAGPLARQTVETLLALGLISASSPTGE